MTSFPAAVALSLAAAAASCPGDRPLPGSSVDADGGASAEPIADAAAPPPTCDPTVGATWMPDAQRQLSFGVLARQSLLWQFEKNVPTSLTDEQTATDAIGASFGDLVISCGLACAAYQLDAAANCGYGKAYAKPYWIPQLVDDVDVCARELGDGWHLPTEAEIAALTDADLTAIGEATAMVNSLGQAFLWTSIYTRGTDGGLAKANLSPDATPRVTPFGAARDVHAEGTSLRCLR